MDISYDGKRIRHQYTPRPNREKAEEAHQIPRQPICMANVGMLVRAIKLPIGVDIDQIPIGMPLFSGGNHIEIIAADRITPRV